MRKVIPLTLLLASAASAQQRPVFTAETALDVANWTAQDLSEDGWWLAASSATRRGALGVDHRRDGDPTYIRPQLARLWVANTATGERREIFKEPRTGRAAAWSPDAGRLAAIVEEGDAFALAIWERATGKLTWPRLPADKYVAENSELAWSRDGSRVLFALRSRAWKERVTRRFEEMTNGPVFVQSSKDPFLAWDDLRREGFWRSIAAYEIRSGKIVEVLPEGRVTTWNLAEDDSTVVWQEDVTPKTDYDVIFGTETRLLSDHLTGRPSERLTVLPSVKGLSLVWTRDGLRFAYAKDGRLYVGSARDTLRRQLAGRDSAAADPTPPARPMTAPPRSTAGTFHVLVIV